MPVLLLLLEEALTLKVGLTLVAHHCGSLWLGAGRLWRRRGRRKRETKCERKKSNQIDSCPGMSLCVVLWIRGNRELHLRAGQTMSSSLYGKKGATRTGPAASFRVPLMHRALVAACWLHWCICGILSQMCSCSGLHSVPPRASLPDADKD